MKLLLVDDERYVIESIKKNICWERRQVLLRFIQHLQ